MEQRDFYLPDLKGSIMCPDATLCNQHKMKLWTFDLEGWISAISEEQVTRLGCGQAWVMYTFQHMVLTIWTVTFEITA